MSLSLFLKLAMVALVVGTIFFLSYIFPNIRTPKWRRKIISAKYLRDRQHFDLADQVLAVCMLFAFAFAMAGVNPVAVAGVGKIMSPSSMGVMLPVGSLGAIIMPWIIGLVADGVSLQAGMLCNLVPCVGILILSLVIRKTESESK